MKLARRNFLRLASGAVALTAAPHIARADDYPTKPARLLVGFPPGGQVDIVARVTAQWLGNQLGQNVVVENKPGAGGNLGAEAIVNAPPDGYTLFFGTASNTVNATLFAKLSYDFARDIAPVSPVNRINLVLEANPATPFKSVAELIAFAKANPGKLDIASPSPGTPPFMAVELFKMLAKVDIVNVPYGGEGQMITDLLGGQIKHAFGGISAGISHIKDGGLVALGVTTAQRVPELPDVPSIGDTVPGFEASGWSGVVAPKNTPKPIVDRLYSAIVAVQADPKFRERLSGLGVSVLAMTPDAFGAFIVAETEKWGKVVKFAGLKPAP
jgi:tripartite-type tricarboxylate transporter receptor subunit TctC